MSTMAATVTQMFADNIGANTAYHGEPTSTPHPTTAPSHTHSVDRSFNAPLLFPMCALCEPTIPTQPSPSRHHLSIQATCFRPFGPCARACAEAVMQVQHALLSIRLLLLLLCVGVWVGVSQRSEVIGDTGGAHTSSSSERVVVAAPRLVCSGHRAQHMRARSGRWCVRHAAREHAHTQRGVRGWVCGGCVLRCLALGVLHFLRNRPHCNNNGLSLSSHPRATCAVHRAAVCR